MKCQLWGPSRLGSYSHNSELPWVRSLSWGWRWRKSHHVMWRWGSAFWLCLAGLGQAAHMDNLIVGKGGAKILWRHGAPLLVSSSEQPWSWSSNTLATWCKHPSSLEKTLMLGKIRVEEDDGMRWLDGIVDSMAMSVSKLWEMVKDREAWHASVHGVTKNWTQLSNWKTTTKVLMRILRKQSL